MRTVREYIRDINRKIFVYELSKHTQSVGMDAISTNLLCLRYQRLPKAVAHHMERRAPKALKQQPHRKIWNSLVAVLRGEDLLALEESHPKVSSLELVDLRARPFVAEMEIFFEPLSWRQREAHHAI